MAETVKRRRRWPWLVFVFGLLAVAPLAWCFWPNPAERKLLGTWRSGDHPGQEMTFQLGRRLGKRLRANTAWAYVRQRFSPPEHPVPETIEFDATGRLRLTSATGPFITISTWERVP